MNDSKTAIERLRELLKGCGCSDKCYSCGINFHGSIADEIEAEIESRYMLLPVDADGVPIHVGDVMTLKHGKTCEVVAVSDSQFTANNMGCEKFVCHANLHRHVKPRTIEDVLIDAMQFGFSSHAGDDVTNKAREFADEIRELMEVDE